MWKFYVDSHLSLSFRLLTMCTRHFGSVVTQTIRTYKTDQFPLLLIVMGKRTSNEVLNVIQGKCYVYIQKMLHFDLKGMPQYILLYFGFYYLFIFR